MRLEKFTPCKEIYELWNQEYSFIFPITLELFNRNLQDYCEEASFIAKENDEIVGFIISKVWTDSFEIPAYNDMGWISLIYVAPKHRKQGIGTKLLTECEQVFKKLNKHHIAIGRDLHNYFPGLPSDLISSLSWFTKKGYEQTSYTYDLIRSKRLGKLDLINQSKFSFRTATLADKDNIITFMRKNWPGRWTKEVIEYFEKGGTGREYFICLDNKQVIAFAKLGLPDTTEDCISYSLTWRDRFSALGGIGPLGVDQEYRGKHLGYDIVAGAVNVLVDQNVSDMIIDWTGLIDFYRKLGFEVWKSYAYLGKNI